MGWLQPKRVAEEAGLGGFPYSSGTLVGLGLWVRSGPQVEAVMGLFDVPPEACAGRECL